MPLLTVVLAFFIGGIVVFATTGSNPLSTYKAIFEGAGLNWFLEVGSYEIRLPFTETHVWFPWNVDDIESVAAFNLQQTLIAFVPLVLTGLAVGFAFRCGMFNIGGQGQYLAGAVMAVWVGSELPGLPGFVHILAAVVAGALMGALLGGHRRPAQGARRDPRGDLDDHAQLDRDLGRGRSCSASVGRCRTTRSRSSRSRTTSSTSAKLGIFWGDPVLQALHVGFFVALAALVVYWITLNRTTLGYEVRAVGFNPEAAHYGGISVARNYFLAMAISGTFAGLAGAIDIVGWAYRINTNDVLISSQLAFVGIAVALLGRNQAIGIGLSALLFASLVTGTSTRNLDPEIFRPELASNLTLLIQGLVVLFVGADVLILSVIGLRRRRRLRTTEL